MYVTKKKRYACNGACNTSDALGAILVSPITDHGVLTLRDHIEPTLPEIGWKSGSFI
jgi:hypothetical protein